MNSQTYHNFKNKWACSLKNRLNLNCLDSDWSLCCFFFFEKISKRQLQLSFYMEITQFTCISSANKICMDFLLSLLISQQSWITVLWGNTENKKVFKITSAASYKADVTSQKFAFHAILFFIRRSILILFDVFFMLHYST